jgi:hypothetical protein
MSVSPITMDELAEFSVDKEGQLYWRGKRVKTEQRITFSFWQGLAAVLVTTGTFASGLTAVLEYFEKYY